MRWHPDKRRGPPGGNGPSSSEHRTGNGDNPEHIISIDRAQLRHRPVLPDEIPELRRLWWRQAAQGHRLPAEVGVIVVEGGARHEFINHGR